MKIKVLFQSYYPEIPSHDYWDMTMIRDIFAGKMWTPVDGWEYTPVFAFDQITVGEGAIVVIPARYHNRDVDKLNEDIARLPWVVLMIVGDEESFFPTHELKHPNMKLWVMTPIPGRHKADHFLPHGYTPDCRKMLAANSLIAMEKPNLWFFSGQITHVRRQLCSDVLKGMVAEGVYNASPGFGLGLTHEDYFKNMAAAKIIPCPSGPATPDSFRVIEALEAGCMPVADECTPDPKYPEGYWINVFGQDPPFWRIRDWESFPGYVHDIMERWPHCVNKASAWWQGYKRKMVYDLQEDISSLGMEARGQELRDKITVIIPTSPISMHPDHSFLWETVASIRRWLRDSEIILMFDGVRHDLDHYRANYEEYMRRVLWLCNHDKMFRNVLPLVFDEHTHQAGMTRKAMDYVRTPLILFVEHDTPIIGDHPIEWDGLCSAILKGSVDMIRFHYDTWIYDSHRHLMLDDPKVYKNIDGMSLIRTIQWSQRPHLASASFYRRILRDNFSENARTMIEDRMHSVVQHHYADNPVTGWNDYRLAIYSPAGYMQRSYHLDGRKADSKFEDKFTY